MTRPRLLPNPGRRDLASRADAGEAALLRLRTATTAAEVPPDVLGRLDDATVDAVELAGRCGAPHAPVAAAALAAARHRRRVAEELEAAIAPARTVARGLVALPLVAVPGLALVTGTDLVGFYLHDPLGRVLALAIVVLLAVAGGWMRAILARALPRPGSDRPGRRWPWLVVPIAWLLTGPIPALAIAAFLLARRSSTSPPESPHLAAAADLVAVAVAAGHDLPTALRSAAEQLERRPGTDRAVLATGLRRLGLHLALRPDAARGDRPDPAPVARLAGPAGPLASTLLELARSGAPGVDELHGLATSLRDRAALRARAAAGRLPARLTFPTVLVLVPTTVLAIGAPIVLQGLAGLTGT